MWKTYFTVQVLLLARLWFQFNLALARYNREKNAFLQERILKQEHFQITAVTSVSGVTLDLSFFFFDLCLFKAHTAVPNRMSSDVPFCGMDTTNFGIVVFYLRLKYCGIRKHCFVHRQQIRHVHACGDLPNI